MACCPFIFWAILLPAIIPQLGVKISCNGQKVASIAPIPTPRPGDTVLTIPGCDVSDSFDCLVAATAFGMPDYCKTYATTANCVIYLTLAFCGDINLPAVQNDTEPLQNCINSVPSGPCNYNSTGRACTSGLFSAFKFLNDSNPPRINVPPGGGPGPAFELELDIPEAIFGGELDPTWNSSIWTEVAVSNDDAQVSDVAGNSEDAGHSVLWYAGQFMIGIFKNLVNTAEDIAKLSIGNNRYVIQAECAALRKINELNPIKISATDLGCKIYKKLMGDEFKLHLDNAAQEFGDIFAQIALLLIPEVEAAEAAEAAEGGKAALGIGEKIAELFEVESVDAEADSTVLRAKDADGKPLVEIWAKGDDGYARPLTKEEAEQLKSDLGDEGFKDLEACVKRPGRLPKRMDGVPFEICADFEAQIAADAADAELLGGPGGLDEEDFPFDFAGAANEIEEGPAMAFGEAELPLAEAAPLPEAAQAQYVAVAPVQAAVHADQFIFDFGEAWVEGPPVEEGLGEGDVLNYDLILGGDMELDLPDPFGNPANPEGAVLDEAGPSNPNQYETAGSLDRLPERPPRPPLNDLPRDLDLNFPSYSRGLDNLRGLSNLERASFGDPELAFQRVRAEYQQQYLQGVPTFGGAPLEWEQAARSPEGLDPANLAKKFQNDIGLPDDFMVYAKGYEDASAFGKISNYPEALERLPKYEGIAHAWQGYNSRLVRDTVPMRNEVADAITWFNQETLRSFPKPNDRINFLQPGLPLNLEGSSDTLFIIITQKARLIGPALEGAPVGSLIYNPGRAVFKYLGRMRYRFPGFRRGNGGDKTAYLVQEMPHPI